MSEMSLGEGVDFLLRLEESSSPLSGRATPEESVCPSAAVFWDVRAYVHEHFAIKRKRIRPNALLKDVFKRKCGKCLDSFLSKRFGVRRAVRRRVFGFLPLSWTGFVVYGLLAVATYRFLPRIFWWYVLLAPIVMAVVLCRLIAPGWPRSLITVGDLVNWVIRERRSAS